MIIIRNPYNETTVTEIYPEIDEVWHVTASQHEDRPDSRELSRYGVLHWLGVMAQYKLSDISDIQMDIGL